ncbi:MAG TPA: replication-associated recombination protein A [Bdellovibrionota bacterium]|nr:replication-associated recombination protein A [Bdellovibrionota bacterium]
MSQDADLFSYAGAERSFQHAPLAQRMRPKSLNNFFGQEHLVGPGKILSEAIKHGQIFSIILWGPPGSGKTTLAHIIAQQTNHDFTSLSAVHSGTKDLKETFQRAKERFNFDGKRTILFIDEIHRFNKAQQDALLPDIERGTATLIGATTENPSFEVNSALLSRSKVLVLKPLSADNIRNIVEQALQDEERGFGLQKISMNPDAFDFLVQAANGDARSALNALEVAVKITSGKKILELADIETAYQRKHLYYDKKADAHYDTISAFHKSLRGSDPDAALYYLARMIEAGEDPLFIARRMVNFASEDIGNADPRALTLAISVAEAVKFLGLPECRINLAQGVTYLALAPKSNASYVGIEEAIADVHKHGSLGIPLHIRNAPTHLMKSLGYGKGYQYAHDQKDGLPSHTHLPPELNDRKYYRPTKNGLEEQIGAKLEGIRKKREEINAR